MSTDATAVADPAEEATAAKATASFFEKGVAVDVVSKERTREDGTTFHKPLAKIQTKYKPDDAQEWKESHWFEKHQVLALRDLLDRTIAEMESSE